MTARPGAGGEHTPQPQARLLTHRVQVPGWIRTALLTVSVALCLSLAVCYTLQPDACVALTIWPTWLWLLPGLLLAWMAWSRAGQRAVFGVTLLWVAFLLVFAEEPRSLTRLGATNSAADLRVVSLNCAGGSVAAAEEVKSAAPDLVLLQEVPTAAQVQKLGAKLFGPEAATLCGLDTAILARGQLRPGLLPHRTSHTLLPPVPGWRRWER